MKTALITGAARGIGRAIAEEFLAEGYNVAAIVRTEGTAPNGTTELICDVTNFEAVGSAVKAIKEQFGSIDVLVNNAGITADGLLARMSEDAFDSVINTNLKGVWNFTRHTSGMMTRQKSGRIINITSVAGLYGNAGQVNYSASKAGVIGITKSAAKELGPRGITVNAIAPGYIETDMTEALTSEQKSAILDKISLRRAGKAQEVAKLCAFLASENATYITAQVIEISGGISM
jgi:Dehydrogenases with different specificities (related to short-chain alcohol dehydrogenases)